MPRVSHEPRYSDIGPSLTFAINAAPSKSTEKSTQPGSATCLSFPFFFFLFGCRLIFARDWSRAKMIRQHGRDDPMPGACCQKVPVEFREGLLLHDVLA